MSVTANENAPNSQALLLLVRTIVLASGLIQTNLTSSPLMKTKVAPNKTHSLLKIPTGYFSDAFFWLISSESTGNTNTRLQVWTSIQTTTEWQLHLSFQTALQPNYTSLVTCTYQESASSKRNSCVSAFLEGGTNFTAFSLRATAYSFTRKENPRSKDSHQNATPVW